MTDSSHVGGIPRDVDEAWNNPLERLRLLSGDDDAVASFLDELHVSSPREREMLAELARPPSSRGQSASTADHRQAIEALESLRRHGFHGSRAGASLGPFRHVVRWLVELVARYLVVSHLKNVVTQMRNLYWAPRDGGAVRLPRVQAPPAGAPRCPGARRDHEVPRDRRAVVHPRRHPPPDRRDAVAAARGFTFEDWWVAVAGRTGRRRDRCRALVDRAPRDSAWRAANPRLGAQPLQVLWDDVGYCGKPPKDGCRNFAIIAIVLTVGVWIVLPAIVALALAT